MKHGIPVMFSDTELNQPHMPTLGNRRNGIFIEHPDTDEKWCRIIAEDTGKITIARTEDVVDISK